ncbi:MAG: LIC_13387 family protein [Telluria sp.]
MSPRFVTPRTLYICCAAILLLFALGHTAGFLLFTPPHEDGQTVLKLMRSVPVGEPGQSLTYYGFYRGFGLLITVHLVFLALVALAFAGMLRGDSAGPEWLGWVFWFTQIATLILSVLYFSLPPVMMSAVLTILSGAAVLLARRTGQWSQPVRAQSFFTSSAETRTGR